ncbi:MAG: hypothetical protein GY943_34735 [Chloroflexi bacterium]|nr:hypothetical protein [Chloroflexota bacterium]
MNNRCKLSIFFAMLFGFIAIIQVVIYYYPYFYPPYTCFTRNGIAIGDKQTCRQASTGAVLEAATGTDYNTKTRLPWIKAEIYRKYTNQCRKMCLDTKLCSFYFYQSKQHELPNDFHHEIFGLCTVYQ